MKKIATKYISIFLLLLVISRFTARIIIHVAPGSGFKQLIASGVLIPSFGWGEKNRELGVIGKQNAWKIWQWPARFRLGTSRPWRMLWACRICACSWGQNGYIYFQIHFVVSSKQAPQSLQWAKYKQAQQQQDLCLQLRKKWLDLVVVSQNKRCNHLSGLHFGLSQGT